MRVAFLIGVTLAAAACAAAPQLNPVPAAPSAPAPQPMNTDLPAEALPLLPALREDAARRSGARAADLRIVGVEDVTWADGGLGCAQPGQMVTMALVPGWRIVLEAPGRAPQHYHASRRGGWVWCPAERSRTPPGALQRM